MPFRLGGVALTAVGVAATVASQTAMGRSWRADVDPDGRTPLVMTGPFRSVRNPILGSTAVTVLGLALVVPNVFAALMLVTSLAAWQIQVRLVEEPYLLALHGDEYRRYAGRTGRFVPGIGRLTGPSRGTD
jgi:protein-S-isoprenylcysteine O-methyltransferase Ste14